MTLEAKILARLRSGRAVAAQVAAPHPDARAYLVILPQCPGPHEAPERWVRSGNGEARLRDPADVTGYEIRYLQHHECYTDEAWGSDYDHVLADPTTRVRRIFVRSIEEVAPALAPWSADADPAFQHPHAFDSSLVASPIESYLDRPEDFPHLADG
jgi:hypothetical protein